MLIAIGLIAVAAASPAAGARAIRATRVSFAPLYYFYRQLIWIGVALPVMIGVSMLPKHDGAAPGAGRRGRASRCCSSLVPLIGVEVNGARRWIGVGFAQFQPSEFLKPLFIVTIAWLLSLKRAGPSLPVVPLTGGADRRRSRLLLMQQPNFGETIIFGSAWVRAAHAVGRADARARHAGALRPVGRGRSPISSTTSRRTGSTPSCSREGDTYQIDMRAAHADRRRPVRHRAGRAARASSACPSRTPTTSSR